VCSVKNEVNPNFKTYLARSASLSGEARIAEVILAMFVTSASNFRGRRCKEPKGKRFLGAVIN
jgi:hypothetical protein